MKTFQSKQPPLLQDPIKTTPKQSNTTKYFSPQVLKGPPLYQIYHSYSPMASVLIFTLLSFLTITRAQDRAPHGLAYENPMAFSPSAVGFFHPDSKHPGTQDPCAESNCSPLPLAATVASSVARESKPQPEERGRTRLGAGGAAGIVFGFVCAVVLAIGVYYVAVTRRANLTRTRTSSIQPDA